MNDRLDPDIAALLCDERRHGEGAPSDARARLLERVQASIVVPSPLAPPKGGRGGGAGAGAGSLVAGARAWLAAATIGVTGVAVGLGIRVAATPPSPVVSASPARSLVSAAPPQTPAAPPAFATAASAPSPEPTLAPPAPQASVAASAPAPVPPRAFSRPPHDVATDSLAAERAVLDHARYYLLSGDPASALREVDAHARRFPAGVLAEERDALRVESLAALGRADDARAAAARFRAAHPGSLLSPAVDDALGAP